MENLILTRLPRPLRRLLGGAALALALAGCTPQSMLASALIPDGTTSILLSHLQGAEEGNRKRVAELEARKDWDGLAKFADDNLAKDKNNVDWWFVAGYANTQAGRHPRAIECYSEMVRLAPDEMLGWGSLAQSYRDAKQPLRAVQVLNNAHNVRKGSSETYFLLGESYADLNRDLPATEAYREALKLNREFAQAWFGLGRASARLGRAADYESALKELAKLNPARAKELAELRPGPR
jgi:predicted Zn-dependent protease